MGRYRTVPAMFECEAMVRYHTLKFDARERVTLGQLNAIFCKRTRCRDAIWGPRRLLLVHEVDKGEKFRPEVRLGVC